MSQYAQYVFPIITSLYMSIGFSIAGPPLKKHRYQYLAFYLIMIFIIIGLSLVVNNFFHSTLEMISNILGSILIYSLIFKTQVFKSISFFAIVYIVGVLAETFFMVLLKFIGIEPEVLISDFYLKLLAHLFNLLIILLCIYIKPVNSILRRIANYSFAITIALVNFLVFFLMVREIIDFAKNGRTTGFSIMLIYSVIIIITVVLALYFYIKREREIKALKRYTELKEEISPLIDYSIKQQHDFKNHLLALRTLFNNENQKGVEYIDSLTEELQTNNEYLNWCNPILGALIQRKKQEANQMNIEFTPYTKCKDTWFPVKDHELISIISNLLDNAFEATSKLPEDKRKVELTIGKTDKIFISVKNTCQTNTINISNIFKRGYTTKKDSKGLGLFIVKSISRKYNGEIDVFPSDTGLEIKIIFDSNQ